MHVPGTIGAFLVAAACAACGGSTPLAAISPNPAAPSPATGLSTDHAVLLARYPALRPGPAVATKRPGNQIAALGFTPDGRVISAVGAPPKTGGKTDITLFPEHIELIARGADHGQVLPEIKTAKPIQIVGAVADDRTVAWVGTATTDGAIDQWVIEAYDRTTHRTRIVARAANFEDAVRGVGRQVLFLAGGRLYWDLDKWLGSSYRGIVYSADPTSGTPRTELTHVEEMAADGNDLFYVKSHTDDPSIPKGQVRIHHRVLTAGTDTVVETLSLASDEVLNIASTGGDLAWSVSKMRSPEDPAVRASLWIRRASGTVTTVTGTKVFFGDLVLTPDLLAWCSGTDGGTWLLDRKHDVVVELANTPGYGDVLAGGTSVLWLEPGGHMPTGTLRD